MTMHVFHSGAWRTVTQPSVYHSGSWRQVKNGYVMHSGAWREFYTQATSQVHQYYPTDTQAYRSTGAQRTDNGGRLYQGYYSSTYGEHRSMLMFNYSQIQSDLAGHTISSVTLRLYSDHFYYGDFNNPIGTTRHGVHNTAATTAPASFSETSAYNSALGAEHNWPGGFTGARDQEEIITLPNGVGEGLRDGTVKGLTLYAHSTSQYYYCYFYGYDATAWNTKPLLTINSVGP